MFVKKNYFGLTGTTLNVAIGVLAGLDFLLFGYDQGVMGGLLDLPSFVRFFFLFFFFWLARKGNATSFFSFFLKKNSDFNPSLIGEDIS